MEAGPVGISPVRSALGPVGIEERVDPLTPFVCWPDLSPPFLEFRGDSWWPPFGRV